MNVGVACVLLSAAGCNADDPAAPSVEPLRQIDIPEDFTFAMTRGVSLEVRANAELAFFAPLQVQVSLPDGGKLYQGPVEAGTPKQLEVLAPKGVDELVVQLVGRSKTIEQRVTVDGAMVQVDLR